MKKLLIPLIALGTIATGSLMLGGTDSTDRLVTDLHTQQEQFLKDRGQYVHVPKTEYSTGKFYEVNEFLYPDKTRGYQVILTEETTRSVKTATGTSQVKDVSVRSEGVGKEANDLTYERTR